MLEQRGGGVDFGVVVVVFAQTGIVLGHFMLIGWKKESVTAFTWHSEKFKLLPQYNYDQTLKRGTGEVQLSHLDNTIVFEFVLM